MLIEFKVANYRSIRAEQTLSMVASNYSDELPQNLISCDHVPGLKGTKLVKAVALYGANASGKSNIVAALRFVVDFVRNSATARKPDSHTGTLPFRFDAACEKESSRFELQAIIEGIRMLYGLELTKERVVSEYLIAYPKGRPQIWFERDWDSKMEKYRWSKSSEHFRHDSLLRNKARKNASFLATAAQFDQKEAGRVWKWFETTFCFQRDRESRKQLADFLGNVETRREILEALVKADLGITDATLEKHEAPDDPKFKQFHEHLDKAMEAFGEAFQSKTETWKAERDAPTPKLIHRGKDGVEVPMDFYFEESEGTRRFLGILCEWGESVGSQCLMIADELETSLHPILARELVLKFTQFKPAIGHPQLIFTTHNPLLLDQTLLRRDQIWFTEKDQEGATRLYPLTDFKPRKDESLVKGYLAGRYGGIPFIPEGLKF